MCSGFFQILADSLSGNGGTSHVQGSDTLEDPTGAKCKLQSCSMLFNMLSLCEFVSAVDCVTTGIPSSWKEFIEENPLSSSAELTLPIGDEDFCSFSETTPIRVEDMKFKSFATAMLTCSEGLRRKFLFPLVGFLCNERFLLNGVGGCGLGVDDVVGNSLASCLRNVSSSAGIGSWLVKTGALVFRRDCAVRISLNAS